MGGRVLSPRRKSIFNLVVLVHFVLQLGSTSVPRQATPAIQQNDQDKTKMKKREKGGREKWDFSKNNHCALGEGRVTLSNRERENE